MLASLPLRLLPFTAKQQAAYDKSGFVEEIAFKTVPSSGKLQIKQVLQRFMSSGIPAAALASQPPVWVDIREQRIAVPRGSKKPAYYLQFFLVDAQGQETLAAVGEDSGDAHYTYHTVPEIQEHGQLECRNRRELIAFLDRLRVTSQGGTWPPSEPSPDMGEEPEEAAGEGLDTEEGAFPHWVSFRVERTLDASQRRRSTWYLKDDRDRELPAVIGEERDTRDGHYTYSALAPFAEAFPLSCSNMGAVNHWLEARLAGLAPEPVQATDAEAVPTASGMPSGRKQAQSSGRARDRRHTRAASSHKAAQEDLWLEMEDASGGGASDAAVTQIRAPDWPPAPVPPTTVMQSAQEAGARRQRQELEQREHWALGQVEAEKQQRSSASLLTSAGVSALLFVQSTLEESEAAAADNWLHILRSALESLPSNVDTKGDREPGSSDTAPQEANGQPETTPVNVDHSAPSGNGVNALAHLLDYGSDYERTPDVEAPAGVTPMEDVHHGTDNGSIAAHADEKPGVINGHTTADQQAVGIKGKVLALVNACQALRQLGGMHATLRLIMKLSPTLETLHDHHEAIIAEMSRNISARASEAASLPASVAEGLNQGTVGALRGNMVPQVPRPIMPSQAPPRQPPVSGPAATATPAVIPPVSFAPPQQSAAAPHVATSAAAAMPLSSAPAAINSFQRPPMTFDPWAGPGSLAGPYPGMPAGGSMPGLLQTGVARRPYLAPQMTMRQALGPHAGPQSGAALSAHSSAPLMLNSPPSQLQSSASQAIPTAMLPSALGGRTGALIPGSYSANSAGSAAFAQQAQPCALARHVLERTSSDPAAHLSGNPAFSSTKCRCSCACGHAATLSAGHSCYGRCHRRFAAIATDSPCQATISRPTFSSAACKSGNASRNTSRHSSPAPPAAGEQRKPPTSSTRKGRSSLGRFVRRGAVEGAAAAKRGRSPVVSQGSQGAQPSGAGKEAVNEEDSDAEAEISPAAAKPPLKPQAQSAKAGKPPRARDSATPAQQPTRISARQAGLPAPAEPEAPADGRESEEPDEQQGSDKEDAQPSRQSSESRPTTATTAAKKSAGSSRKRTRTSQRQAMLQWQDTERRSGPRKSSRMPSLVMRYSDDLFNKKRESVDNPGTASKARRLSSGSRRASASSLQDQEAGSAEVKGSEAEEEAESDGQQEAEEGSENAPESGQGDDSSDEVEEERSSSGEDGALRSVLDSSKLTAEARQVIGKLQPYVRSQMRRVKDCKQGKVVSNLRDITAKVLDRLKGVELPAPACRHVQGKIKELQDMADKFEVSEQPEKGRLHRVSVLRLTLMSDQLWELAVEPAESKADSA
ncbi:hypothetical protein WJX73_005245 [Symbiochloris irregularis]|uniref:Uncharacterized protein n=1 Tax=Symbiochloris irregularis TaxID=706552 RepID=A0AAW1PQE2_9CHLO